MKLSRILDRFDSLMESDNCPREIGVRYLAFMRRLSAKIKTSDEAAEEFDSAMDEDVDKVIKSVTIRHENATPDRAKPTCINHRVSKPRPVRLYSSGNQRGRRTIFYRQSSGVLQENLRNANGIRS